MDTKVLEKHIPLIVMIYRFFHGSIRYEDLSEIIKKTNYNDVKSDSAVSRFFTELRKADILVEGRDFDRKRRYYLNKAVIAHLKKVDYRKVSAVSKERKTLIKSNFKVRYFIEQYIDQNEEKLPLKDIVIKASKVNGNIFNKKTSNETLDRIVELIGESNLRKETFDFVEKEKEWMNIKIQKQKESLKLGPSARKKIAEKKAKGLDPCEEFDGIPIPAEVKPKQKKRDGEKRLSLDQLKRNDVYLSDIVVDDVKIPTPYVSSISPTTGNRWRVDYTTHFKNLKTKQITFKFVHFCSATDIKTSRLKTLYKEVVDYSNNFQVKNNILKRVKAIVEKNFPILEKMDSSELGETLSDIKFPTHELVHVVVEFEVIFMNQNNFERVKSKILKNDELKNKINSIEYCSVNTSTKINFRHYNIYPMNEHCPI